jgi:hypothetical protein
MSDFEFVKDPQEIREMFFAHRHRAWNNIDIRENTSELQHPEDTLDIVWNLSNLGFGGYYGGSSLLPGTGSVFNIYFEDSVSKFGIKISPFTFFNSGNQIAGGGLTGASLSFLNLDLYWNPLFSVSGNGIFGPFISLNYLTYNRRESNFWTNVSAAAGWRLTLMTELSKDHWGILGKDSVGLGGYHNTLVGIDAGYRYLNGDHYLYFEIGTDLVNIVYAATIAASLVMLFSSPGQNTEKTK